MAPVPRFERIAAGVYVMWWAPLLLTDVSISEVFLGVYQTGPRLLSFLRQGAPWSFDVCDELLEGLECGSLLAALVLLALAVLRAVGIAGFLGGRLLWWGAVATALAASVGRLGFMILNDAKWSRLVWGAQDALFFGSCAFTFALAAYVLMRTHVATADAAAP